MLLQCKRLFKEKAQTPFLGVKQAECTAAHLLSLALSPKGPGLHGVQQELYKITIKQVAAFSSGFMFSNNTVCTNGNHLFTAGQNQDWHMQGHIHKQKWRGTSFHQLCTGLAYEF